MQLNFFQSSLMQSSRNFPLFSILAFLTFIFASHAHAYEQYKLDTGDTINIHVFGQNDLERTTLLSDSGKISYPFLGEIKVRGLTVVELEKVIYNGLKGDYLVNPNVSVTIVKYRPFFISGEVKKAGGYPYQPGLTVAKAAALAGGFTERASRDKIFLISSQDQEQTPKLVSVNTKVGPGDIITVKQSFF